MVGEGVEGGVAVVGVGVEGELCVCAEVLEGAGKQFGLGDHFPADLFGTVAAAFVFADADADCGVGGKGGRWKSRTRRLCHQTEGEASRLCLKRSGAVKRE